MYSGQVSSDGQHPYFSADSYVNFGHPRTDNNCRNSVETVYSVEEEFMAPENFYRKAQGSPKGFVNSFDRSHSAPISLGTLSSMSSLTLEDTNAVFQAALTEQHSMGWGGRTLQSQNPQQFRYQNETSMFQQSQELSPSFHQLPSHQQQLHQHTAPKHATHIDQNPQNSYNRHRNNNNHGNNNRNNQQRNHRNNNGHPNHHHHNNNNGNGNNKGQGYRRLWQQVTSINQGGNLAGSRENPQSDTTTVEDLLQLVRRLPPEASAVKAVSQGLFHLDSGALAALLKELNKAGHSRRAQEIFDWLRTLPPSHDLYGLANTMTYTTMISQCGMQQALRRALELVAEMRARGIQCNVHTYSALMNVCIKGNELDLALDVYRQMIAEGCTPNLVTYNTLIDVYGKTGAWESAIAVLDALHAQGIEPEVRTYNTVIIACNQSSRAAEAVSVYERMLAAGAQPTATTYTALISAYGKAGQLDAALRIFQDMLRRGCERNVITYSSLISACEKAGRWELALELFQEMHTEGCKPNVVTFNSLIAACAQGAQWERAKDLFDMMQSKGCKPDSVTFGALISAYDRAGQWQQALSVFEHMKGVNCRPDTVVYNTVIGCLWKTGLVWAQAKATQIFHTACRHGHFRMTIHSSSSSSSPSSSAGDGSSAVAAAGEMGLGALAGMSGSAPASPLPSPGMSVALDRCSSLGNGSDVLAGTTMSTTAITSPAKTTSTSSGGSVPGSPMFGMHDPGNIPLTSLVNPLGLNPAVVLSDSEFGLNRSLSLPLPSKENPAVCTFRSNSPAPLLSSSAFSRAPSSPPLPGLMGLNSQLFFSGNSMSLPLSPVATAMPTTPIEGSGSSQSAGSSVEFGMHAFTVGSAVLSLLRWVSELKDRLPKDSSRMDSLQTVALVLNKGKPSREHTYPAIRDALLSMVSSWHAPMTLKDIPQGCRIEAAALDVVRWLTSSQAENALERFHGRGTTDSPNRNVPSDAFFRDDSLIQARCAEAFAAVSRFEVPGSAAYGCPVDHDKDCGNRDNEDLDGAAGGRGNRRSEVFDTAATFASACGFSGEVLHDGYLLVDRCMRAATSLDDALGASSVNAVIMACLCIAGEQAGEIDPATALYSNAESLAGLSSGDIQTTQSTIKSLLRGNTSSISALRVLKLYLERLGAEFSNSTPNNNGAVSKGMDSLSPVAGTAMEILPLAVCDTTLRQQTPSLVAAAVLIAGRRAAGLSPFWPQSLAVLTNMMETVETAEGETKETALSVASARAFELACGDVGIVL